MTMIHSWIAFSDDQENFKSQISNAMGMTMRTYKGKGDHKILNVQGKMFGGSCTGYNNW